MKQNATNILLLMLGGLTGLLTGCRHAKSDVRENKKDAVIPKNKKKDWVWRCAMVTERDILTKKTVEWRDCLALDTCFGKVGDTVTSGQWIGSKWVNRL
jgi:hypothetical protein